MHSTRQYAHYSCSAFKSDSFYNSQGKLLLLKGVPRLLDRNALIVLDKIICTVDFALMRNLSLPDLFPVSPEQVTNVSTQISRVSNIKKREI